MQRCGEAHPQGLRALLGLQLPEQDGKSADEALWTKVLVTSATPESSYHFNDPSKSSPLVKCLCIKPHDRV